MKWNDFDFVTVTTSDGEYVVSDEKNHIRIKDISIDAECAGDTETIYLSAETSAVEWVRIRWNQPVSKKALILGDAWERSYAELHFQGISGVRTMPWYFIVSDHGNCKGYGVKVRPSAMCFWQADTRGITLYMDVRCGGDGVILGGRKIKAAELVCMESDSLDSFHFTQEFCKKMCDDPIFPEKPVYGGNNWYYAYGDSSEADILRDTDCIARLTEGLTNRPYMVIDDCWQEHHRLDDYNGGPWRAGNEKFPDMKALAERISEKNVLPGIWVRLLQNEDESIPEEWRSPLNGCLDPTHPDALNYIREDVERMCRWGYRLIKHDFSTFDLFDRWGMDMNPDVTKSGWHFRDRSKTSAEVVKMLYEAIYEATKPYGVLIIGCDTIGHLGAGLMQMHRIGDDVSGVEWERTRKYGVNTLAFRMPQHRTFFDVDADCAGITPSVDWKLNRQWVQVLAESGTTFFASIQPGALNEAQEAEMKEYMKLASEQKIHKIPLDWEETDCPEIWGDENGQSEYNWYPENGNAL